MILRSITSCLNFEDGVDIDRFFDKSKLIFKQEGFVVRTNRLCLPPLEHITAKSVVDWATKICDRNDVRWMCAPFDLINSIDHKEIKRCAFRLLNNYPNLFVNFILGENYNLNWPATLVAGKLVKLVSTISTSGYDNFRFGVSFNCPANSPFFPFTHQSGPSGFSIACEFVPEFIRIINEVGSSDQQSLKEHLIDMMVKELKSINEAAIVVENNTGFKFYGIDASLAPYPDKDINSVGNLIETLGVESFGGAGTLYFTSYLTDIIKEAIKISGVSSIGFNGVMYSVLEDSILSKNDRANNYSIDTLTALASVCGCGIDMVPIPGKIFVEEIASIMLDIGALSCKLHKPLGVRLLPVPMRSENQLTQYNFDFLCNTRIKKIKNLCCIQR